jgi:hypothetical protein
MVSTFYELTTISGCHGARVKRSAQPEADKPRLKAVKAWGEPSSADKTMADSDEKGEPIV